MLKIVLVVSNVLLVCFGLVEGMFLDYRVHPTSKGSDFLKSIPTKALGYRDLKRVAFFGKESTGVWNNGGVAGGYSLRDGSLAVKQLGDEQRRDIESLLGYCRCHFIYSVRLDSTLQLNESNISGNAMKAFYERNVKNIESDTKISKKQAKKLAFVTCFEAGWKECMKILDSVLKNSDGKRLSMGLSHKYSLEEAYIILHMHPSFMFWNHISREEWDAYVNVVAGALNTVTNGGEAIPLREYFNRQAVLVAVVGEYFGKFLLDKDASQ